MILHDDGLFTVAQSGWKQTHPAFKIISDSMKLLNDFDNRYGLNLVAGQKIEMPDPPKDNDLIKALNGE